MMTVTPQAADQIRNAASQSGAHGMHLRVAAKRLADGSVNYGIGFDHERENDNAVESQGVTLLIAPQSKDLLENITLDYVELEPGDFQFIFIDRTEHPLGAGDDTAPKGDCGRGKCGCG